MILIVRGQSKGLVSGVMFREYIWFQGGVIEKDVVVGEK